MNKVTVFAKERKTHEGRPFTSYFTKLKKKNGEEVNADVRFTKACGTPSEFPVTFDVTAGNVSHRTVEDPYDGSKKTYYTLWVKGYENPQPFEDNTLDEFM